MSSSQPVALTAEALLLAAHRAAPAPLPCSRWVSRVLVEQVAAAAPCDGPVRDALSRLVGPAGAADVRAVDDAVHALALVGALAVRQGPDGAVYALTDQESGEILRLTPAGR